MFKRRNPLSIIERLTLALWPRRGWLRQSTYVAHRLGRLPGSPYSIAAGFAAGVAVSFTPFIGLHFVLAAGLALLLRANVIASAIGTVIGNPWTFPFIWSWIFTLGHWLLGSHADTGLSANLSMNYIIERPLQVLLPMIVGGLPTGVVAWFVAFIPLRSIVERYRYARRKRLIKRELRRRKLAKEAASARLLEE